MSDVAQSVTARAQRRPRTLLLLVLSATIMTLCMGLRQSMGLFVRPMTIDLGITASAISFVLALQNIVWGISQPFMGMLADRYGPRPVLMASAAAYAGGLLLTAAARSAIGLDIGGFLMGLAVAGSGFGVLIGVVSRATPPERRSQTVGAVTAAASIGTFVLAPVGQALISGFGWRIALIGFAAIAGSIALFSIPFGQENSETPAAAAEDRQSLGDTLRAAATHPGYVAMTVAFFACGFQLVFITTHLPSFLAICGLAPSVGATALGIIGLCNTAGTFGVGLLGARYSQKRLLALVYLLRTLAIIIYIAFPISVASTVIFAAAMGLLWLSVAPLVSVIIGKMFGLKHFSMLYGFVFFSHQLGSFCGAWLGGVVFDYTGSYEMAWIGLIVIGLLAFALQWPMDDRPPAMRRRNVDLSTAATPA